MATESLEDPARRYAVLFPDGSAHVHADAGSMSARTQAQLETAIWNASAHPDEGLAKVVSCLISDLRTEDRPKQTSGSAGHQTNPPQTPKDTTIERPSPHDRDHKTRDHQPGKTAGLPWK